MKVCKISGCLDLEENICCKDCDRKKECAGYCRLAKLNKCDYEEEKGV